MEAPALFAPRRLPSRADQHLRLQHRCRVQMSIDEAQPRVIGLEAAVEQIVRLSMAIQIHGHGDRAHARGELVSGRLAALRVVR